MQANEGAPLKEAHAELMAGYRAAMLGSDQLDPFQGALVKSVVAVSSAAATKRLRTRLDAPDITSVTEDYARDVAKEDYVSKISDKVGGLITQHFSVGAVLVGIGIIFRDISNAGHSAELVGSALGARVFFYPGVLAAAWRAFQSYQHGIEEAWQSPDAAKRILAQTLDGPEGRFFAVTGTRPPVRIAITLIGPILAVLMIGLGLLAAYIVAHILYGAFSPYQPAPFPP